MLLIYFVVKPQTDYLITNDIVVSTKEKVVIQQTTLSFVLVTAPDD